jgi:hypothetical protein
VVPQYLVRATLGHQVPLRHSPLVARGAPPAWLRRQCRDVDANCVLASANESRTGRAARPCSSLSLGEGPGEGETHPHCPRSLQPKDSALAPLRCQEPPPEARQGMIASSVQRDDGGGGQDAVRGPPPAPSPAHRRTTPSRKPSQGRGAPTPGGGPLAGAPGVVRAGGREVAPGVGRALGWRSPASGRHQGAGSSSIGSASQYGTSVRSGG